MGENISTIQRSPRINTSYKFAAPRYRLPPMALQAVQVGVEPRLSTALKDRSVVPSQRLSLCPSPLPRFQQRCLSTSRRDACERISAIQAVLKAEPLPFEKKANINLVYSSCLKHANKMLLGRPRQADQRTQSLPFPILIHQSLDPAARALKRQAPSSLSLHALENSTGSERVDA